MHHIYFKFSTMVLLWAALVSNAATASPEENAIYSKKEIADHFLGCVKSLEERTPEASIACLDTVAGDLGQFNRWGRRDSMLLSGFAFVKGVLFLASEDFQHAGKEWLKSENLETGTGYGAYYTENWDCVTALPNMVHFDLAVIVAQVALNRYDDQSYSDHTRWPSKPVCLAGK